jgi:hypothetical protein
MDFGISNSVIVLNWVIRIFSQIWKIFKIWINTFSSCCRCLWREYIYTFRILLIISFLKIIFHKMAKVHWKQVGQFLLRVAINHKKIFSRHEIIYIYIYILYSWLQTALFYFILILNHFYCSPYIPRLQTTIGSSSQLEWSFSAAMFGTSTLWYLVEADKPGVDSGSVTKKKVED